MHGPGTLDLSSYQPVPVQGFCAVDTEKPAREVRIEGSVIAINRSSAPSYFSRRDFYRTPWNCKFHEDLVLNNSET
jgi:hypothetical protein